MDKNQFRLQILQSKCQVSKKSEIIQELELKQAQAKVNKLLCLILSIPATSAISLKHADNHMRCSQSEEQLI